MKVDILAIGAHPDDIEFCCGGTLLKHIDLGYKIGLCDLTQGELGTRGSAQERLIEAEEAKQRMGVTIRENLNMQDGYFQHNKENINKIIQIIRKYQPNIVLANSVKDRHPDHGRAGKLIEDACFYAGLKKIKTTLPHRRPKAVYHYTQDRDLEPDFLVDISDYIEQKRHVMLAYKSQFYDQEKDTQHTIDTIISQPDFLNAREAKYRTYGRIIGTQYAEAFVASKQIGVKNLFDII